MQAREQRHLGRFAQIFLSMFDQLGRFFDFLRVAVRLLLQDRQVPDRLIELEIFFDDIAFAPTSPKRCR